MPRMNGADFLEKVREQNKEVVTMLLTGQANFDDLCEVVRRGRFSGFWANLAPLRHWIKIYSKPFVSTN
jgi:DNA-binding NtrC family response regulator